MASNTARSGEVVRRVMWRTEGSRGWRLGLARARSAQPHPRNASRTPVMMNWTTIAATDGTGFEPAIGFRRNTLSRRSSAFVGIVRLPFSLWQLAYGYESLSANQPVHVPTATPLIPYTGACARRTA